MRPFPALIALLVSLASAACRSACSCPCPAAGPRHGGVATGSAATRVRPHGLGQRARRRPEPVRRARPGARRAQRSRHPRLLLPGHAARAQSRAASSASCSLAAAKSLTISSTAPYRRQGRQRAGPRAPGRCDVTLGPDLQLSLDGVPDDAAGAADLRRRLPARCSRVGTARTAGRSRSRRHGTALQAVDVVGARGLRPGCRPGRDAEHVAAGRAPGAGDRGAVVRACDAGQGEGVGSLSRRAQPAVPRRRCRDAGDDRGGQGDERDGAALRRRRRDDVLLVVVRRPDAERSRRLRSRRPLPARPGRSVGRSAPRSTSGSRGRTRARSWRRRSVSPLPSVDVQARFSPSGRVVALSVDRCGRDRASRWPATEARKRLGLRSTAFHLATLRFLTPPTATSAGQSLCA